MADQPLPELDWRNLGKRGVEACRAELERAKATAARERLGIKKTNEEEPGEREMAGQAAGGS